MQNFAAKGVSELFTERKEKGLAKIIPFSISEEDARMFNLRLIMSRQPYSMRVYKGNYVKLIVDGELMMSDTDMEINTNIGFINRAKGRVLIAGLGIGMVLKNILKKKEVTEVIVVEKYSDVIDLVASVFNDPRLKIINEDIFYWLPEKGEKFDTIYFDIWPTICEDNLEEIALLHMRFKRYKRSKECFMESWVQDQLRSMKRRNR